MDDKTIFVQIASYRDPELLPTIKDALERAANPERLVFCICWQHSDDDDWDNLDLYKNDPRFKILNIPYKVARGACWARWIIQQNYGGEDYTLQLDSHHRFVDNWDQELIEMLESLRSEECKKPLLTAYIPNYYPTEDPKRRGRVPWKMNFDKFTPEGIVFFLPAEITNFNQMKLPIPARFYSGHFTFADGTFAVEVQHDPSFYFHGEEITLAVRAYTHGYDLFHPHKIIAWHEYTRKGRTKQWDDDATWYVKNNETHQKVRKLLGVDGHVVTDEDRLSFGIYGLGTVRTQSDWERYSGIRFSDRGIQQWTRRNNNPPNPHDEYETEYYREFKHNLKIPMGQFKFGDYKFCAIILENDNYVQLHRHDLSGDLFKNMIDSGEDTVTIPVNYIGEKPTRWVIWPYSNSKGWIEKTTDLF